MKINLGQAQLNELIRKGGRVGIASLCVGGGQRMAIIIESLYRNINEGKKMPLTVNEIKTEFENCPFFQQLGLEIISFEEENVKIKLDINQQLLNTNGTLHGGVYASVIDFIQSMHLRSVTKTRCVHTNLTVHYTAPIKNGTVYAEASIISRSYKTAFVDGILRNENDEIIAKGTGTFKLIHV